MIDPLQVASDGYLKNRSPLLMAVAGYLLLVSEVASGSSPVIFPVSREIEKAEIHRNRAAEIDPKTYRAKEFSVYIKEVPIMLTPKKAQLYRRNVSINRAKEIEPKTYRSKPLR